MANEIETLRQEITSLRNQIDILGTRGDELLKQNHDLKAQVERLSKNKLEVEELQKQKEELFAMIIHDIKNPASLIKSLVDLLRSYDLTTTEQHDVINDIFETTTKIVNLSQEVSRILALEGSNLNLNLEKTQVNEVIQDVYQLNKHNSDNKHIEMLIDLKPNLPEAYFDPQKIYEVIENLVSNAIKFSQKGGQIRLRTSKADKDVVIEVSDNGVGLSEDDVKKAFQRGNILSAKPTAGENSTGLGLWIVKKIVEAHKGRVWVKSALGIGSTFAFSIPIEPLDDN